MSLNNLSSMFGARPVREVAEEAPDNAFRIVPPNVEVTADVAKISVDAEKMQLKVAFEVTFPTEYANCLMFQNYFLPVEDNIPAPEDFDGDKFRKECSKANQLIIFLYETGVIDMNRGITIDRTGEFPVAGLANALGRTVKFRTRSYKNPSTGKEYTNPGFLYASRTDNTEFVPVRQLERFSAERVARYPKNQAIPASGRIDNDSVIYAELKKIAPEIVTLALEDRKYSDPLPAGTIVYGTVIKCEEGTTQSGKDALKLVFTVRDDPKRRVFASFVYSNKTSMSQIASFLEATGIVDPITGQLTTQDMSEISKQVVGKELIFSVGIYNGTNTIDSEFGPVPPSLNSPMSPENNPQDFLV